MGWAATHRDTGVRIEGRNDYNVRDLISAAGGDPADDAWEWEMTPVLDAPGMGHDGGKGWGDFPILAVETG